MAAFLVASPASAATTGAPLYETFPVIKLEPQLCCPEVRKRKRKRRKHVLPRSRSPSKKKKKRRRNTPKVKKLVLVSNGNGIWEVKHKRQSRRSQSRMLPLDDITERSCHKSDHAPRNVDSETVDRGHYNQMNGGIILDGEVPAIISNRPTCMKMHYLGNTDGYEHIQPENVHISTSECSLMNTGDVHIPACPDDGEADPGPDVIILEETEEADNADADVIIVEDDDKADPDVVILEEVTNQTFDNYSCADLENELVTNINSPTYVRSEYMDMDYNRELVPLEVPERFPETYLGDFDTRGATQQRQKQQWHQPQLPLDNWEQQPSTLSPTEADYTLLNHTVSQLPLHQGHQTQRQRILQDVMELNHTQLPRSPPLSHEPVHSNQFRWHQPQALPERPQNENRPRECQCGSVHETAAVAADGRTFLQGSRLVLCEEQVEKETRIENASQFLKTFHGVHSDFEEPTPQEAVFQEPETTFRQCGEYPKTRQELSEEYQFQQSYRTVKTEEYQFVKTIFKNSIPSQRYITAQSVAVDRQVIYKEEYKIIPQPQLEWNI